MSSRITNSLKNYFSGIASKLVSMIMSFVVRTFFIITLSSEYLGVNGLFSNILTILSLAELGFGTAILYSLYEPLAQDNQEKISSILNLFKKIYNVIGIAVLVVGLCLLPFLSYLIGETKIDDIKVIYILYLINTAVSYFSGAYKKTLLIADQKQYIINLYSNVFLLIKSIGQIIVLLLFKDFVVYLVSQIILTILENLFFSVYVSKKYIYLKEKSNKGIERGDKIKIFNDVKALFFTKVGHVMLNGTDNMIVSRFVGLNQVGLLSNYVLIVDSVSIMISQIINSCAASIGNFLVTNTNEDNYEMFKNIDFINFWINAYVSICVYFLINDFVKLWLGEGYVFENNIVLVISLNFFINGMINFFWIFRTTLGLFLQGKYRSIITGLINIIISLILAKKYGIFGVLLGTTISRISVSLWYDPYIVLKFGFNKKVFDYLRKYVFRFLVLTITIYLCFIIKEHFICTNILEFIACGIVLTLMTNLVFSVMFLNTAEFKYILALSKRIILKK